MNILLVIQDSGAVDSRDPDLVPLHIMHVILIDSELSARKRYSGHLVLKRADVESSRNHVVQEKLNKTQQLKYLFCNNNAFINFI